MVGGAFVKLVEELKGTMSIQLICEHLGIVRSTYYRWKNSQNKISRKIERDQTIGQLCSAHKFRYGYRKLAALFPDVCEKTVQRVMQKYNWSCRVKVKKRKRTGQPAHVAENQLNRAFRATAPFQKLTTDITYLPFGQSILYLSSIMDLYNGEIIAYTIGPSQDTAFVLDTLRQLEVPEGALLHSNQGSVYTSYEYQKVIKENGIIISMSRKGTPADNSPNETFHFSLKSEEFYTLERVHLTNAIAQQKIEDYMYYYNYIRPFQKLNCHSPIEYRTTAA